MIDVVLAIGFGLIGFMTCVAIDTVVDWRRSNRGRRK
jgi:hypothetical protein